LGGEAATTCPPYCRSCAGLATWTGRAVGERLERSRTRDRSTTAAERAGRRRLEEEQGPAWREYADRAIALGKNRYTWREVSGNTEMPESRIKGWARRRQNELET
jgi:hypothetical protein